MQRLHSGAVSHVREVRQQHTLRSFEWTSAFLFSFSLLPYVVVMMMMMVVMFLKIVVPLIMVMIKMCVDYEEDKCD
jgi:hypothetical protein